MVYDIRAGEQNWAGVGDEVTRQPRMGFLAASGAQEWLSIVLHLSSANPTEIPTERLSLYENGRTRIGDEGAWHLVRCTPAGAIGIVELSTQPPAR